MTAVEANNIVKSYANKVAVNDLSFTVAQGEIFGLIGPNGAGKTTTIRMMLDIIKPDSGNIIILGEKLSEASKNTLGYLPEERGLYKKLTVIDSLIYLASLKGMDRRSAERRADELLDQTGMLPHKRKKIEELSKGMAQLIQFIVTIIHDPHLVILDEPFAALDPINTELLKTMFIDLRNRGKAIILSTHRINEVEQLCDRVLMINNGQSVLYGNIGEIKSRYRNNSVLVDFHGEMGEVFGVTEKRLYKDHTELILDGNTSPQELLGYLLNQGIIINRFEVAQPSLNEIFLKVVGKL